MAFPDTNVDGFETTHTIGNKVWNWDGEKWILQSIKVGAPSFAAVNPVQVENLATTTTYSLDAETLDSLTAEGTTGTTTFSTAGSTVSTQPSTDSSTVSTQPSTGTSGGSY